MRLDRVYKNSQSPAIPGSAQSQLKDLSENSRLAIVNVLFLEGGGWDDAIARLMDLANVRESVILALQNYRVTKIDEGHVSFKLRKVPDSPYYFGAAKSGRISIAIASGLIADLSPSK